MTFIGLSVVEKNELRSVNLIQLRIAGELRTINQYGTKVLDATSAFDLSDATARHVFFFDVGKILF